jgi:hypothetical protein
MIKDVLALLGLVRVQEAPERQHSPVAHSPQPEPQQLPPPSLGTEAWFANGLEALAADSQTGPIVSGSLELVGLEDVRHALGDEWDVISDTAIAIATMELQLQLGETDIFRLDGKFSFIVCFAELDRAAATMRAGEIALKIKSRLAAEIPEIAEVISVDHFVTNIDRATLNRAGMSITEQLFETLRRVRNEVRATARRSRMALLRDIQLQFAPAWHTSKHVTVLNRCLLDQTSGSRTLAQFQALAEPTQINQTLAELDCMLLTKAIETLHQTASARPAGALLTPVSFRTLANPRWCVEYLGLLQLMPGSYKKLLILEISDVPPGTLPSRLGELIEMLKPFVKGVSLEVPIDHPDLVEILEQGSWALAANIKGSVSVDPQVPMRLKRFAGAASAAQTISLAHGANSMGLALAAVNAGFNYVDGPAIHPMMREPKAPSALNPLGNSGLEGKSVRW